MGQYYKAVLLNEDKVTVKNFLWPHHYDMGAKLMETSYLKNGYVGAFERLLVRNPQIVVWAGDYAEKDPVLDSTIYTRCTNDLEIRPATAVVKAKYICNHTKKEFVNKSKVMYSNGWHIHPLPLLTCEGNGQGGGDFYGDDEKKLVGSWARNLISVETVKPKGYKEIIFDLEEK